MQSSVPEGKIFLVPHVAPAMMFPIPQTMKNANENTIMADICHCGDRDTIMKCRIIVYF